MWISYSLPLPPKQTTAPGHVRSGDARPGAPPPDRPVHPITAGDARRGLADLLLENRTPGHQREVAGAFDDSEASASSSRRAGGGSGDPLARPNLCELHAQLAGQLRTDAHHLTPAKLPTMLGRYTVPPDTFSANPCAISYSRRRTCASRTSAPNHRRAAARARTRPTRRLAGEPCGGVRIDQLVQRLRRKCRDRHWTTLRSSGFVRCRAIEVVGQWPRCRRSCAPPRRSVGVSPRAGARAPPPTPPSRFRHELSEHQCYTVGPSPPRPRPRSDRRPVRRPRSARRELWRRSPARPGSRCDRARRGECGHRSTQPVGNAARSTHPTASVRVRGL